MKRRVALLALATVLLAPGVSAQVGAGALMQTYRFDDPAAAGLEQFRLTTLPFMAAVPLGSRLTLDVSGAYAEGTVTGVDGFEATLSGPTDTQLGVSVALGPDRVVLTGGLVLATGQSTQTFQEAAVAGVVAAELLPFAISTWGSGGGAGGDVAVAFQAGRVGIGFSGGYQAASEYEPLSDLAFAYRPGDQLRFRFALDADVGEAGTFSLLLGLQRFGQDAFAGVNLFQSGTRLEGLVSYAFPTGLRGSGLVYGGVYHRENGSLLTDVPSLEGATDSPSQQLFVGGANFRLPAGARAALLPDLEMRVFRSADGIGQGWVGSAGATLDLRVSGRRFGRRLVLGPTARFRFGSVTVNEDAESGLKGWEAGLTLRLEGGR